MATDTRMNYAPNLALGICITVIGIALTLDKLRILEAERILRFWPVGLILFGAGVVAQSFWPGAGQPGADGKRKASGTPLFVLVVIVAGFLIGPRLERRGSFLRSDARDTVSLFAVMSEDQRSSNATKFRGGEMTSFMGSNKLDLRQATLAPGEEAVIDVFAVMGGVELRVPDGWTVVVQVVPVMGGVRDQRMRAGDRRPLEAERVPAEAGGDAKAPEANTSAAAPRVVVRGFIIMGGLVIKS
jgi:hypothetical protein